MLTSFRHFIALTLGRKPDSDDNEIKSTHLTRNSSLANDEHFVQKK